MRAKILRISEVPSKYSGTFFYIFFKGEDLKSYKSCIGLAYRNFKNWSKILQPNFNKDNWIDGLQLSPRDERLIDADSIPRIIEEENQVETAPKPIQSVLFSDFDKGRIKLREAMEVLK